MSAVPTTQTAPADKVPLSTVTADDGAPPFAPTLTSRSLSVALNVMSAPVAFQISMPFGVVPESVSVYWEMISPPFKPPVNVVFVLTSMR